MAAVAPTLAALAFTLAAIAAPAQQPVAPTLAALAFTLAAIAAPAQQPVAPDAGCALQKGVYLCNWSSFKLVFDRAHSVAIQVSPLDRPAAHQAQTLVTDLGKTPASAGQPADLTLLIQPTDPTGMNFGPSDHDLATLRLYAPAADSPRGTLLWVETLRGQGDRPWPAQVHTLLTQFQDRFPKLRQ